MPKVKNPDELKNLRNQLTARAGKKQDDKKHKDPVVIKIAMATCSIASGARDTFNFITAALKKRNIDAIVTRTGCMGYCYAEPTIEITLPGTEPVVFGQVDQTKADEIIEKYLKKGELVDGVIPKNYESPW